MTKSTAPTWVKSLRIDLRSHTPHGAGWSAFEHKGNTRLTYRFADGQRSSCVTEIPWSSTNKLRILNLCSSAVDLLEDGKTLADAIKLIERADASTTGGATNWPHLAQLFYEHKTGSGQISERTWKRNYRLRIDRAVEILTGSPAPTGGKGCWSGSWPPTSPRARDRAPPTAACRSSTSAGFLSSALRSMASMTGGSHPER